jgi:hypothetical protein
LSLPLVCLGILFFKFPPTLLEEANRQYMPYQYKREPLSDDEVNRLTNACEIFKEKFAIWTLLDTHLGVSSLAAVRQQLITMRHGLYADTFNP